MEQNNRKDKIDKSIDQIKRTLLAAAGLLVELKSDISALSEFVKAIEEIESTLKRNDSPDTK